MGGQHRITITPWTMEPHVISTATNQDVLTFFTSATQLQVMRLVHLRSIQSLAFPFQLYIFRVIFVPICTNLYLFDYLPRNADVSAFICL